MTDRPRPDDPTGGIPADRRARNPLITRSGWENLRRIEKNTYAPIWNYEVGDRLLPADLPVVEAYRRALSEGRPQLP